MGRPPCCDKSNVKRGLWTAEEDAKILAYVATHGVGNWTLVPKKAGLNRCGKSCRLRWTNYLRPDLKHDSFTPEEEALIINLHKVVGSRWSLIARELPGRTDNDVKNYWNTKLRKKLQKMGIDPVTHKPFSQIFTDFRNLSGLLVTANQIGSFNKNLNPVLGKTLESAASVLTEEHQNPMMPVNQNSGQFQVNNFLLNNNPLANVSPSWDTTLSSQFSQLELEAMQANLYYNEVTSSTSSSATVTQAQDQTTASSSFGWSDFLVGEPFLPAEIKLQEEGDLENILMQSTNPQTFNQDGNNTCKFVNGVPSEFGASRSGDIVDFQPEAASSSVNSFVEAILDSDNKMRSEFTELLDGSFEY